MQTNYVRYQDDVETIDSDEAKLFEKIVEAMARGGKTTREKYGHSVRTSHAKSHGLLKGELQVLDGLAEPLRQGLFGTARTYPVIARLAHVPGELLDDRKVSTPRGMAIKILEVEGPKLANHESETTQDWVLDTGKIFNTSGPKTFLAQIAPVESLAPVTPQVIKGVVSTVSLATNAVLNAVGLNSANADFFGHPNVHPLAEAYYTQTPLRYGDYVAKLRIAPNFKDIAALQVTKFDAKDENAMRLAVAEFFRSNEAEFEVGVQLCTDLKKMPIEDAHAEWSEDDSPFLPVARLVFPAQDAYSDARQAFVESLLFCPSHSLQAHRPLGGINRARMVAYDVLGNRRRQENGQTTREVQRIDQLPA